MNGRIKRPEAQAERLILPRVGKIKIGMKAMSRYGKEYPMAVDYFIPTGKYAGLFTQAYGEKPQTIQIVFPDDDAQKVCCEYYEYRSDKGELIATGDGELFNVWDGKKYKPISAKDYPNIMQYVGQKYPNKAFQATGDGWRVRLTLNFIVPMVRGIAGLWTFETNGTATSIPQVRDTFDAMLNERGFCKGIIFDLNVQFAKSQKPGDASRYPVVTLVPNESRENLQKIFDAKKPIMLENK